MFSELLIDVVTRVVDGRTTVVLEVFYRGPNRCIAYKQVPDQCAGPEKRSEMTGSFALFG
ncbi:hypothetical protein AB4380_00480 [Vibrio breoganii]